MHLLIKNTFTVHIKKNTHVKNVCDAYLKLNLKNPTCFGQSFNHHQGSITVPCAITTCQHACLVAFHIEL